MRRPNFHENQLYYHFVLLFNIVIRRENLNLNIAIKSQLLKLKM